jgi:uncharacterized membrane protein YfcA
LAGVLTLQLASNPASLANGTSTVALCPGSFASVWGYRRQIAACKRWLAWLTPPSIIGGAVGAAVLVEEDTFRVIIPWLILLAAILYLLQPTVAGVFKRSAAALKEPSTKVLAAIVAGQFLIGVYGGYFGAGIGILMLSSLSFLGLRDIHQTNALKSLLALCMNVVAAGLFIARGLVVWEYALAMAAAAIAGGYAGARLALFLRPAIVRWIVIVIGVLLGGILLCGEV